MDEIRFFRYFGSTRLGVVGGVLTLSENILPMEDRVCRHPDPRWSLWFVFIDLLRKIQLFLAPLPPLWTIYDIDPSFKTPDLSFDTL